MIQDNIRMLCKEHGITIQQLEKDCGIGNGVIARWDVTTKSPNVYGVAAVAKFFGVTVDYLLQDHAQA